MKRYVIFILFLLSVCFITNCGKRNPQILLKTELGDVIAEIYVDKAPVTANNFLRYVDDGIFKNSTFYRTVRMDNQPNNDVKIEVIQGGLYDEERMYPPIIHETTDMTGILHKDGVLSMARLGPGTATSEFFICVGDQPELDFAGKRNPDGKGFAAFGKVVSGMEIVRKIQIQSAEGQMLNPRIKIFDIFRTK